MKGYLIVDALTRDAIVIGQVRRDTALYGVPSRRVGRRNFTSSRPQNRA